MADYGAYPRFNGPFWRVLEADSLLYEQQGSGSASQRSSESAS